MHLVGVPIIIHTLDLQCGRLLFYLKYLSRIVMER